MSTRLRARLTPYALLLPGGLWLLIFFVVPLVAMLSLSLQQGDIVNGYTLTWHWQTYVDGIRQYHEQIIRSLIYGAASTVLQLAIGYPVAYWIAFHGGRRKSLYLFLLLLPFFVSFVLPSSDYVNAAILGGPGNSMIGNVIQHQYLVNQTYPTAAALSFTLMAILLIGIFSYARALGTEDVLKAAAK